MLFVFFSIPSCASNCFLIAAEFHLRVSYRHVSYNENCIALRVIVSQVHNYGDNGDSY